jgi:hypothetical protein
MKQKIFVILVFLVVVGTASAYDSALSALGWGLGSSDTVLYSPLRYSLNGAAMYFQAPNAGNVSLTIRADGYPTISCNLNYCVGMEVYGLNYSGGTETWTLYDSVGVNSYSNPGMQNWSESFSAYSNVGVYKIVHTGGGIIQLYPESSYITYNGAADFFARTYGAGTYVTVPLLNRYYPQITTISGDPIDGQVVGLGNNNTEEPYYLAPIFLSCAIPSGLSSAYVLNSNGTDPAHDWQMYYFNFEATAHKSIGFQYASDTNASSIYILAGGSHTFVIGVNNSESLSGVGWYVSRQFLDGSFGSSYPIIPTTDKNVSFTYSPPDNYGRYRVEAQLEDTYCTPHRFVTYTWYISLGASVSLSGYVSTGIMNTPVVNASVEISCPSGEADRSTMTDANGAYSFTGLGAGQYTLDIIKSGYSCAACPDTFTLNATLDGVNPYNRDYVLSIANVTTTTMPASTVIMFSPNWRNVTDGEFQYIGVSYYYGGVPITGATCNYSSSGISPASGTLDIDGTGYSLMVEVSGSGTSSYTVTCSKTGYVTKSATDTFDINTAGDIWTEVEWLAYSTPVQAGRQGTYRAWYGNQQGMVEYADCVLNVNGTEYTMSEISVDEGYGKSVLFTSAGSYPVNVSCSKTGYLNATSETRDIWVFAGSPPTTLPNHCVDLVKNYDETDIDCGGTCDRCIEGEKCKASSDCVSNYCSSGFCRSATCTDDIKNGDENGIDCGGSCYPCACFKNSDCSPGGSEHCQDYSCVRDNCTTTCSSITWSSPSNPFYDRPRYCVNGVCLFTVPSGTNESGNISSTEITIQIAPIGPYYVWNNNGSIFYVSNCEDATNGYTVSSSKPTQKSYFHVDPSVSPYVPTSTSAQTFSPEYSLTYSGLIPKLCEIPVGGQNVSSLIVFYLNDGTSGFKTRSVYSLTFRERFKVNATYQAGSGLTIYLSRPGTCRYRVSAADAWTNINTVPGSAISLTNASMGYKYSILCNNSYNETASTTIGKGSIGFTMVSRTVEMVAALFDSFVFGLVGVSFADWWRPEYIIILIACVFILFPSIVAFLIFAVLAKKKPDAHKGKA